MNSPFNEEQTEKLNSLLPTLTETQKVWLSGYLTASQATTVTKKDTNAAADPNETNPNTAQNQTREVTLLFGSETGNAQMLAEELVRKLEGSNFPVKLSALDDFKPRDLKKVQDLLIITATHGEGDPPDNAISFHEILHSRKAPKLKDLRFSILSLGDQSYEFFCQTGKDFDKRLEELGGERLYERVDCDLDFDEPAGEWMDAVLGILMESKETNSQTPALEQEAIVANQEAKSIYSRTKPYQSEVMENLNISGRDSNKENHHLELSLEGSNLQFEPGDSLGIIPQNDPVLVHDLINEMDWDSDESVPVNKQGDIRSLKEALLSNFEITVLTKPLMKKAAEMFANEALIKLVEQEERLKEYIDGRDLLDLVRDYQPKQVSPGEFIKILRKMPARLYSISSSYKANPEEVHLTVGTVRYHAHGRDRSGVCSVQLAERTQPGDLLQVYVHKNPNFKFPYDPDTPVIMIGPGTGVAPFRSFLEEREEMDITGKTWLFFGDQHFLSDFLYQVDWQNWLKAGVLTKMDVAFSRDTDQKIYVQHRMLEKSKELYQWIKDGAHVYICGDEKKMASDVHQTLTTIIKEEGGLTLEEAKDYLSNMRKEKRYQRDVY